MKTRWMLVMLVLGAVGLGSAGAKTIVWVSDAHATDASKPGVPDDQGWVDFLTSLGFTVEYPKGTAPGTGYFRDLDAAKLAELQAADLIIMSRDVSSDGYSTVPTTTELEQWAGLTTPLIAMSQYLARNNRARWFNTTSLSGRVRYYLLRASNPEDPLFDNVLLDANNDVVFHDSTVWPGYSSFINTADAGNGRVLAVRPDNGNIVIAEWDAGVRFYGDAGTANPAPILGGPRMFFSGGTQEESGTAGRWGAYNLTAAGEQIFVNALKRYLGDFYYNSMPQVSAGPDQSAVLEGGVATAQLVATSQDDGNPYGIMFYDWTLLSGPAPVNYYNGIADPTVQFTARGAYEFQVTVYDYDPNNPAQEGKSSSDTVRVRVKDPALDDVLLGHWAFEEGAGKTANDSAGINDVGTLKSTTGYADPNWVDGWVGDHALEFYGISYVELADATPIDPNLPSLQWEVSTAAWVKVHAFTNDWATIIGRGVLTWRFGRQGTTDRITIHLENVQESLNGVTNVNDGYWHHVAATYDGKRVITYVDGRVDATMDVSGPINVDMTHPISIGNRMDNLPNRGWNGLIDDVWLYTYAISADDVANLARLGRNVIPRIDAGPDVALSLTYDDSMVIDAVATDLNGDVLNYEWTVVGPAPVEFIPNANVEKPTVRFSQQGVYTFHVTVNDGMAGLDGGIFDEMVVTATRPSCADVIALGMVLPTDLNTDCRVDLQDLAIMAADWVRCYDPQQAGCENPFKW